MWQCRNRTVYFTFLPVFTELICDSKLHNLSSGDSILMFPTDRVRIEWTEECRRTTWNASEHRDITHGPPIHMHWNFVFRNVGLRCDDVMHVPKAVAVAISRRKKKTELRKLQFTSSWWGVNGPKGSTERLAVFFDKTDQLTERR